MQEFFKPWRRKFGVLTLMAACVFVGAWQLTTFTDPWIIPHWSIAIIMILRSAWLLLFRPLTKSELPQPPANQCAADSTISLLNSTG